MDNWNVTQKTVKKGAGEGVWKRDSFGNDPLIGHTKPNMFS